jgi:hypothetical protein
VELCGSFEPVVGGIEFPPGGKAFLEKTGRSRERLRALGTQATVDVDHHLNNRMEERVRTR